MRNLMWFREDLRIHDNTALFNATNTADEEVLAVYLLTPGLWQKHHMAAVRVEFILRGLLKLSEELAKKNIALKVLEIKDENLIAKSLLQLAKENNIEALFFNKQLEVNELIRDATVSKLFTSNNIKVNSYDDVCIISPGLVLSQKREPLKVYTPFKKAWYKFVSDYGLPQPLNMPRKLSKMLSQPDEIPTTISGFKTNIDPKLWPAGEEAAKKRLKFFIENHLDTYKDERDFPAIDATSKLSPYLSTGMISPRVCFVAAMQFNHGEFATGSNGAITWMNELIWREFYKHILYFFPHVCKHQPFRLETKTINWNFNKAYFQAWCEGKTGYPFVDAAMRQLNQTGWMHNRLRMVVAMFLTKSLFIDWRLGEHYFIEHLIDGDLAANNGGWQWSASTGVDAAPYFRIFNPTRQSERFDPQGEFIKQYCPELSELDATLIHEPFKNDDLFVAQLDYPRPIVDHSMAKEKVIAAFKSIATTKVYN